MGRVFTEDSSDNFYGMSKQSLLTTLFTGVVAGAIAWGIMMLLDKFVLTPIFCSNDANISVCASSVQIAANLATVIVGLVMIPVLLRVGVSRVVLVAIASVASLWGVAAWVLSPWYLSLFVAVLTYALVYVALAWICRVRNIVTVAVLVLVFVLLARLVMII